MYEIRLLKLASQNLERLDKSIAQRIYRKLNWIAKNAESIEPKWLRRNLTGFSSLREGDYRAVYKINHDEKTILVRFIGHRSDVYKGR